MRNTKLVVTHKVACAEDRISIRLRWRCLNEFNMNVTVGEDVRKSWANAGIGIGGIHSQRTNFQALCSFFDWHHEITVTSKKDVRPPQFGIQTVVVEVINYNRSQSWTAVDSPGATWDVANHINRLYLERAVAVWIDQRSRNNHGLGLAGSKWRHGNIDVISRNYVNRGESHACISNRDINRRWWTSVGSREFTCRRGVVRRWHTATWPTDDQRKRANAAHITTGSIRDVQNPCAIWIFAVERT